MWTLIKNKNSYITSKKYFFIPLCKGKAKKVQLQEMARRGSTKIRELVYSSSRSGSWINRILKPTWFPILCLLALAQSAWHSQSPHWLCRVLPSVVVHGSQHTTHSMNLAGGHSISTLCVSAIHYTVHTQRARSTTFISFICSPRLA